MSYILKENNTILEKETGHEIKITKSKKELNDVVRKLNLGSGFNGWTPAFFTIEYIKVLS